MYSGFITRKRVVKRLGIHQRFNVAAYRMAAPFLRTATFPTIDQINHFEGLNGPDGLKIKSPGEAEPSHLYDPIKDTGEVPALIQGHYSSLVEALKKNDDVKAAFEASWLAHYITDGLTPGHHFPLDIELAKLKEGTLTDHPKLSAFRSKGVIYDEKLVETIKKNWALWGRKGLMSSHFNFELGVAATLMFSPIRGELDHAKLVHARKVGPIEFFKGEARDVAHMQIYDDFMHNRWNGQLASAVRNQLAPQTAQAIAIIWMLAYLESGMQLAADASTGS